MKMIYVWEEIVRWVMVGELTGTLHAVACAATGWLWTAAQRDGRNADRPRASGFTDKSNVRPGFAGTDIFRLSGLLLFDFPGIDIRIGYFFPPLALVVILVGVLVRKACP